MKTYALLLLTALSGSLLLNSCGKNPDPTPTPATPVSVVGTWLYQSTSGTVVAGGKSIDISQSEDAGLDVQQLIFNANGTATIDGAAGTYTVSGNTLKITQGGVSFNTTVNVANNTLTLTVDEIGYKDVITILNGLNPTARITKLNQTLVLKTKEGILASNGTPDCLVTSYTILSYAPASTTATSRVYTYTYNDEREVSGLSIRTGTATPTVFAYTQAKVNIGSATDPFVTVTSNGRLIRKLYSDRNRRIIRAEFFSTAAGSRLTDVEFYEYDATGYLVKTTTRLQDTQTNTYLGDYSVSESEFRDGNEVRSFYTDYERNRVFTPRYMDAEYAYGTPLRKTFYVYPYTNGVESRNNIEKFTFYDTNKKVLSTITSAYTLDAKGFIARDETVFSSGSRSTYTYLYQCR